jgi:hypothetical protein
VIYSVYAQYSTARGVDLNKNSPWLLLILCLFLTVSCAARPTGIAVTVKTAKYAQVEILVVELYEHKEGPVPMFLERETVYQQIVDSGAPTQAHVRPGYYVVKVRSTDGSELETRKVTVKRNRLTHMMFELDKE